MTLSGGDLGFRGASAQDEMMADIGEKGRPSDGSGSWVQKVMGSGVGGGLIPEKVLDDEFVSKRLHLSFPDGEDGEPVITIDTDVLEAMNGLWKRCMIVKVLGRNISIPVLNKKLREMWRPNGWMHVIDLPRQFFMIRFELEDEFLAAVTGGPWRAFGSYLMVQAWSPDFDPLKQDINTTPVWVRLANIPVNLYHNSILMGIARGLGKPIRVDSTTLKFERARFARVCVEVDLTKPLKGSVMVNGEWYSVAYEGLTNICSMCGLYGHLIHNCPKVPRERVVETPLPLAVTGGSGSIQRDEGFTEVRRRGRRSASSGNGVAQTGNGSRTGLGRNLQEIPENIAITNRFGGLEEDHESGKIREVVMSIEENKENDIIKNQVRKGKSGQQVREGVTTVNLGRVHKGLRDTFQFNQGGLARPKEVNGPRGRYNKTNKPTRSLVFGLARGETKRSESGKRLRVEMMSNGRPGGVFGSTGERNTEENTSHMELGVAMDNAASNVESEQLNREIVGHSHSSQEGVGMTGA